ncbi:MAG: hypothetical protein EAZ47_08220 [Bacteroidetes bacterium]|nr:MAG: hypothetical protein EAZ47_08220 [Bacteroidota bacterium]
MQLAINELELLFTQHFSTQLQRIEKLPQSGSDRIYFRLYTADGPTYIGTYNVNVRENKTFIQFAQHFKNKHLPVPTVFAINQDGTVYIQEDLGEENLLNQLEKKGHTQEVYELFAKSLSQLAQLQIKGHEGFSYDWCLTAKEFGKQAILSDLLYFKYYFLDTLKQPYDKQALLDDFDFLASFLTRTEHKYFMFRDFQSRNIVVHNNDVHFIDFQGGMQGALQYDVASLLWQAKAELSDEWKNSLLEHYMNEAEKLLQKNIDRELFVSQFNGYILIRLLQVLGAYGFRGLFERKAHFLASIPLALKNLRWFLQHKKVGLSCPEFERMLAYTTSQEVIAQFEPIQATAETKLVVTVHSFSYKKGIPPDDSSNGGGFVFDMRSILNPGRFNPYKHLSGKDKEVQDFLEQRTKMNEFLNSVFDMVDIAVANYIERDFESLHINFGCTGGQHRSVYAAEQTARHLRNKFKVQVVLIHTNTANWVTTSVIEE